MRRLMYAIVLGAACATLLGAAPARTQPPALVAFARAWAGIVGYSATVTVFEQKGVKVQHLVFHYTYRKPSSVTVFIVKGSNAGVTLVWNGGSTMLAHHGAGFEGLFKRKFSLNDPLATTIRGSSIDQLSFGEILAHGLETQGTISQRPGPTAGGVATDAIWLVPTIPAADTGLTLEVVEISKTTHFPARVLGYVGHELVRRLEFSKVVLQR